MIKQEKPIDPLQVLRWDLKRKNLYPDHPLSETDEERDFYEVKLPVILKDQWEYLLEFISPKLFWIDRVVFRNIHWFAKKKWRTVLCSIWFWKRLEFIPFEGIHEPFMTFEAVRIYWKTYIIDLPLYRGYALDYKHKVKYKMEDVDVKNGRYVPKDRDKPV